MRFWGGFVFEARFDWLAALALVISPEGKELQVSLVELYTLETVITGTDYTELLAADKKRPIAMWPKPFRAIIRIRDELTERLALMDSQAISTASQTWNATEEFIEQDRTDAFELISYLVEASRGARVRHAHLYLRMWAQ